MTISGVVPRSPHTYLTSPPHLELPPDHLTTSGLAGTLAGTLAELLAGVLAEVFAGTSLNGIT